jgi:nitrilase
MLSRAVKVACVQAEPIWFDMSKTIDKVISLMAEAASNGAELIGFPETWVPGYPWQIWLDTPAFGMSMIPTYHANSPTADGPEIARVCAAAKEHEIGVVLGYSERGGGSLYMGQAIIDQTGTLVKSRRKLKPTHVERSMFGEGDGSDLNVYPMGYGNVGALCCWEHIQPLSKYAMYSMGEDIHVAAWPTFSLYRGGATALGAGVNNAASLVYAVEGGCFVLAPCGVIGEAGRKLFCDTPMKEQLLLKGGGFARIYGPEGTELATPLGEEQEGILYAICEPALQAIAKSAADPTGHYSRGDVTRLLLNRSTRPAVVSVNGMNSAPSDFADFEPVLAEN